MRTPIILLVGKAGSGKDTVGKILAEHLHGLTIAQADPMKRFAMVVFQFSDTQLWGPSSARNAYDDRYETPERWAYARSRLEAFAPEWLEDVLPDLTEVERAAAFTKLRNWFDGVVAHYTTAFLSGAETGANPTPRYVLQTLGTEWGREFSRNMWLDYAKRTATAILGGGYFYTATEGLLPAPENYDAVVITDGRFRNEIVGVAGIGGIVLRVDRGADGGEATAAAGIAGHKSEAEMNTVPLHFFHGVIDNNGTIPETRRDVKSFINELLRVERTAVRYN